VGTSPLLLIRIETGSDHSAENTADAAQRMFQFLEKNMGAGP
jgi:hypothetical protein